MATVILGTVLGCLSGLGVGGGSLLMLWLTVFLGIAYPTARTINLLFFIPTALISCFFRRKQGALDLKRVLPAILFGVAAAAVTSILSSRFDMALLKKLFGGLLIITGLRELFYRPRKAR
jgi:uncharacterized membrane protein YfcA